MDSKFILLLDEAIGIAFEILNSASDGNDWMKEDSSNAALQFEGIKESYLSGNLKISKGAGLGITRALSEWAPLKLYDAGKRVEDYYRQIGNEHE